MIVVFASAKGGAGKSTLSCNIAYHLSKMGYKTLLFDSDVGSSVDYVFFNIFKHSTIRDFLEHNEYDSTKTFNDIKQTINEKLDLISSPNGFVHLSREQIDILKKEIIDQNETNDFIVIDTQAGTHLQNLEFMKIADKIYVIVNMEDQSITDNFSLIMDLEKEQMGVTADIYLITNRISNIELSKIIYENINKLLAKKGFKEIRFAGNIFESNNVKNSVKEKTMFVDRYKNTNVFNQFMTIIKTMIQGDLNG